MLSKKVTVINQEGIHMRPAGMLAKAASNYEGCSVTLKNQGKGVNAKAVMQIMTMGLKKGAEVEIICEGKNEETALKELTKMFEMGFNE